MPWQRGQFHLQQNAQAHIPRPDLRAKVAADIRSVFLARAEISDDWEAGKIYLDMNPSIPPSS